MASDPTSAPPEPAGRTVKVTWAEAVRDICLRAFAFGKFWQVGFLVAMMLAIWRIPSEQWPAVISQVIHAEIFAIVGWCGFLATAVAAVVSFGLYRSRSQAEISRLVTERDHWQNAVLEGRLKQSHFKPKKGS